MNSTTNDRKPQASELAFLFRSENKESFGERMLTVTARLVRMEGTSSVRNLSEDDGYRDSNAIFADLEITAQLDQRSARDGQSLYGFNVQFDVYRVRAARAKTLLDAFRKIERGLERLEQRFGPVTSFAEYVLRVADVLGCRRFPEITDRGRMGFYTECDYKWRSVDGFRYHVAELERKFREECGYRASA